MQNKWMKMLFSLKPKRIHFATTDEKIRKTSEDEPFLKKKKKRERERPLPAYSLKFKLDQSF